MKPRLSFIFLILIYFYCASGHAQQGAVKYAEYSPGGSLILTADFDSLKYRLFDARTKKFIGEIQPGFAQPKPGLPSPEGGVRIPLYNYIPSMARFSPDGKSIYMQFNFSIVNWDIVQKKIAITFNQADFGGLSQDGRLLVLKKGKSIQVYDTKTWKVSRSIKSSGYARISPDGQTLAHSIKETGKKPEIQFINMASGKIIRTVTRNKEYNGFRGFSPDGKIFLSSSFNIDETPSMLFWETSSGKLLDSLAGDYTAIFSPNGKKIITLSRSIDNGTTDNDSFAENFASVWDADTRKLVFKLEGYGGNLTAANFSPDGKKIVTSSKDGMVIIWDAETGERLMTLKRYGEEPITLLGLDIKSRFILTESESTIQVWDIETGICVYSLDGENVLDQPYGEVNPFLEELAQYKQEVGSDTATAEALITLGQLYEKHLYYEKAVLCYEKAISQRPNGIDIVIQLADLHNEIRVYPLAIQYYLKAIAINPVEFSQVKLRERTGKIGRYLLSGSPYTSLGFAYSGIGNEQLSAVCFAKGILLGNDQEKLFFWLEKAAQEGYDIGGDVFFEERLRDNTSYKELLIKYPKKN